MGKKIVILCMSCNQDHFINLENAIRDRWFAKDIINGDVRDVDVYFYAGSSDDKIHFKKNKHRIELPCDDGLHGTYEKTMMCFEALNVLGIEYDYIYRTNCSTMINPNNLKLLVECIKDDEKIYCGNLYASKTSSGPDEYDLYGLGKGVLLSRKWVDRLLECRVSEYSDMLKTDEQRQDKSLMSVDDNAIGMSVNCWCDKHGIDKNKVWDSYGMIPGFFDKFYNEEYKEFIAFQVGIPFRTYKNERDVEFERGDYLWSIMRNMSVVGSNYLADLQSRRYVLVWNNGNMHCIERDVYDENKKNMWNFLNKK